MHSYTDPALREKQDRQRMSRFLAVKNEIDGLFIEGCDLIMSADNCHYVGVRRFFESSALGKIHQEAVAALRKTNDEVLAGRADEHTLSLDPDAPICKWVADKKAFLKTKLNASIQKRKSHTEGLIAELTELEGSEKREIGRKEELNNRCGNIRTRDELWILYHYNKSLDDDIQRIKEGIKDLKATANKLLDEITKHHNPSEFLLPHKKMIANMNHKTLESCVNSMQQQLKSAQEKAQAEAAERAEKARNAAIAARRAAQSEHKQEEVRYTRLATPLTLNSWTTSHLLADPFCFHLGQQLFEWIQFQNQQREAEYNHYFPEHDVLSNATRSSEEKESSIREQVNAFLQKIASHTSLDFIRASKQMIDKMSDDDLKRYLEQLKQDLESYKEAALAGENVHIVVADPPVEDKQETPVIAQEDTAVVSASQVEDNSEVPVTVHEGESRKEKTFLGGLSFFNRPVYTASVPPVPSGPVAVEMSERSEMSTRVPGCSSTAGNK